MRKRSLIAVAMVAAALVSGGVLVASNMGFKLNYTLFGPAGSGGQGTGQNAVGLPYFRQTGLNDAIALRNDIGSTSVSGISKFNRSNNTLTTYPPTNFSLEAGEGYRVVLSGTSSRQYIIVGSHDPGLGVTLNGPGSLGPASTGQNDFAPPYHTNKTDAVGLRNEIGSASVSGISRFNRSNNTLTTYPPTNFTLTPGESYRVVVVTTVAFTPAHF